MKESRELNRTSTYTINVQIDYMLLEYLVNVIIETFSAVIIRFSSYHRILFYTLHAGFFTVTFLSGGLVYDACRREAVRADYAPSSFLGCPLTIMGCK